MERRGARIQAAARIYAAEAALRRAQAALWGVGGACAAVRAAYRAALAELADAHQAAAELLAGAASRTPSST